MQPTLESWTDALIAELEGLDAAMTPINGEDGFVAGYQMKTGIWHRILGMIRQPRPKD